MSVSRRAWVLLKRYSYPAQSAEQAFSESHFTPCFMKKTRKLINGNLRHIYRKLDVHTRQEFISAIQEHGARSGADGPSEGR